MYRFINFIFVSCLIAVFCSCNYVEEGSRPAGGDGYCIEGQKHFVDGYNAIYDNGDINAVIEIPAGNIQKWEVDKKDGKLKWEVVDDDYRVIDYLGYPANYGMIPQTLLPESGGGDGDPLDVLVLGPSIDRGSVIRCRIIGVLYLLDRGEQDDKLIAVSLDSSFGKINSINDLNTAYEGMREIIRTWFLNYKGPGKMTSIGFGEKGEAMEILRSAKKSYAEMK